MLRYIFVLLIGAALFAGCEKEINNPVEAPYGQATEGVTDTLDATAYDHYLYFNLVTRQVVDISDAEATTSSDWHIAFERVNGKLNGGASGPLAVKAIDLADIGHPDSVSFDRVDAVPTVADDQWEQDQINLVFSPWYSYDPVQHVLTPNHYLFVMKTADGKYAKAVVDSLIDPSMPPNMGTIVLKYVYQPDGGANLSGAAQYARLDGSSGSVFFSFAAGGAVTVADPATSTAWDIWFDAYDAKTNGGISGPGMAAVYPMFQESNDFDALTTAPTGTGGGAYFSDNIQSVFGAPTVDGSQWYNYIQTSHEVVSKKHIYILSLPNNVHFALMIENYYQVVDGVPVGGWVTIRSKEL